MLFLLCLVLLKNMKCSRNELSSRMIFLDVDLSITTRELAKMIKEAGINFIKLRRRKF